MPKPPNNEPQTIHYDQRRPIALEKESDGAETPDGAVQRSLLDGKQSPNPVDIPATRHRMPAMRAGLPGPTGARRENGEKNLCSLRSLLLNSGRDGDADFKFLARDTSPTYVDNRPLLVAGKPELREYKAVFIVGDVEVSQFSDEITVNCAPLV